MSSRSPLAEPWRLGALEVPNRICMAPMATHRVDAAGRVTPGLVRFLARRARGGCGLIVVESATVDAVLGSTGRNLRLDVAEGLAELRRLVQAIHRHGAVAVAQLWHAGPRARPVAGVALAASASGPAVRAAGTEEVPDLVRRFVEAGARAADAGFDAVEVHAAHGYLLHDFVDRVTNRRRDRYGRSLAGRLRILGEIRAGLRRRRPGLPALLRISLRQDDPLPEIARRSVELGFDGLDVRTGFSSMPRSTDGGPPAAGYVLDLARRLRPHLTTPLLAGGRILTPREAERAVAEGLDAVLLGRALLADPDWAGKALARQEVVPCLYDCEPSCYSTFKAGEQLRCVRYGRRE